MKHAIFYVMLSAVIAVVTGCSTTDELNLGDARAYMLGATAYPAPSITNYYGGLTVYKKKKGKIYNKEKIIACTSDIDGFTVIEEDPKYKESLEPGGTITNAWAYTTITNDGTYVKFQGNFEDAECWKSKDDDSFLGFVTDTSKLSEAEYKSITNSETQVSIYRKAKFDEGMGPKYDRINTVLKSSITDKDTAIQAFNDLLTGLKAQ